MFEVAFGIILAPILLYFICIAAVVVFAIIGAPFALIGLLFEKLNELLSKKA